jgi:hypothetical protein
MLNYPGLIAVLVEALKREGVRFDESSFPDENITRQNPYIAITRGKAAEFIHRTFESIKSRATTHQITQEASLIVNGMGSPSGCVDSRPFEKITHKSNKRSLPNAHLMHADQPA